MSVGFVLLCLILRTYQLNKQYIYLFYSIIHALVLEVICLFHVCGGGIVELNFPNVKFGMIKLGKKSQRLAFEKEYGFHLNGN